jgi:hypothetical protein
MRSGNINTLYYLPLGHISFSAHGRKAFKDNKVDIPTMNGKHRAL